MSESCERVALIKKKSDQKLGVFASGWGKRFWLKKLPLFSPQTVSSIRPSNLNHRLVMVSGALISSGSSMVDRAEGWKVLRKVAPLAAGAQNIHHRVHDRAHIGPPFAAAGLGWWNQGCNIGPLVRRPKAAP